MTLVVQAHPLEDSYNAALLDAVVSGLSSPHVVRLGRGDTLTAADCAKSRHLLAVYPTWWGSMPAVLLDALNSVVGPWIDGPEPLNTSPLRSIETITVVTSHGSSKLINQLQGEPGMHLWRRSVIPICAPGATFNWQSLYGIDRATAATRADFLESVSASVSQH